MSDFQARNLTEGLNGELGFRLIDWREGFAQISVDLDHRHKNRQGGLHGGTTATLIDAATGFCGQRHCLADRELRGTRQDGNGDLHRRSRARRTADLFCLGQGA